MVKNSPPPQRGHADNLVRRANEIIAQHPVFRGRNVKFQIRIDGDLAVIRGKVPSFYLKQVLQNALKQLEGIRYIDNQVTVISSDGLSERS